MKQEQIINKQKELIAKLQSMVDSGQDYDSDYHEIWVELAAIEAQEEEEVTDDDIEKWARSIRIDYGTNILIEGAISYRYGLIGKK